MYGDIYAAGTATVAAGGTGVVGSGTMWTSTLEPYDTFEAAGVRVTIISIEDNTHLTLAYGWPGAGLTSDPYLVRLDSARRHEPTYLAGRVRDLVNKASVLDAAAPTYAVIEVSLNAPPGSPVEDDAYIVGTSPTGAWAGHVGDLAQWTGAAWLFSSPATGWHAYDTTDAQLYVFTGSDWAQRDAAVLDFANAAAFPVTGSAGVLYVARDTDAAYYWSGGAYVGLGASSTDGVTEGSTNLYFTAARVRAVVLAGLSLTVGTAISAADTVLVAFGKLQKQCTDIASSLSALAVTVAGKEPSNVNLLKGNADGVLSAGFSYSAVDDDGDLSTGTYTPTFAGGNVKNIDNIGAFTIAPIASGYGVILLTIENKTGAGVITVSGTFEAVDGDSFDTTVGSKFACQIIRMAGPIDWLVVRKVA